MCSHLPHATFSAVRSLGWAPPTFLDRCAQPSANLFPPPSIVEEKKKDVPVYYPASSPWPHYTFSLPPNNFSFSLWAPGDFLFFFFCLYVVPFLHLSSCRFPWTFLASPPDHSSPNPLNFERGFVFGLDQFDSLQWRGRRLLRQITVTSPL